MSSPDQLKEDSKAGFRIKTPDSQAHDDQTVSSIIKVEPPMKQA